jgi:hypothetical protein
MGSGRRLRSSLAASDCLVTLEDLLLSYRTPKYKYLSSYFYPGWSWNSPDEAPSTVVCFDDTNDDFMLATLWPAGDGTEFGLFPLGSGDGRLETMPIIGHWKTRDASLSSIGTIPGGKITLQAPRLADDYIDGIVTAAGYPATPSNIHAVGSKTSELFFIKALQFISSNDRRAADHFAASHRYDGGLPGPFCQSLLDDLVVWNPGVLPYIQALPMRMRALLLENVDTKGELWRDLDR